MAALGIVLSGGLGGKIISRNAQEFFARLVNSTEPANNKKSLPFQNPNERSTCAH